jgi:hypothetical protein
MSAVTCPGCGAAAEITERFTLASTDGPVAHVALSCAGGHHYWVSGKDTSVVRRPWCLSSCDDLDRELCDMTPFGG